MTASTFQQVASVDPLVVYIHNDGLARLATKVGPFGRRKATLRPLFFPASGMTKEKPLGWEVISSPRACRSRTDGHERGT